MSDETPGGPGLHHQLDAVEAAALKAALGNLENLERLDDLDARTRHPRTAAWRHRPVRTSFPDGPSSRHGRL